MTTIHRISALALTAAIALSAGCANQTTLNPSGTDQSSPAPSSSLPVSDIPIPNGAKLDTDSTLIMGVQDKWIGRLAIRIGMSPTEAYNFYQGGMPSLGWNPVTAIQSKISTLTFLRGDRVATVQIEPSSLSGSAVSITVSPRQSAQETAAAPSARQK